MLVNSALYNWTSVNGFYSLYTYSLAWHTGKH